MKLWLFTMTLLFVPFVSNGQGKDNFYDSLIMGHWILETPAQLKMLKTMGEPYLQQEIHFKDKHLFQGISRGASLEWMCNEEGTQLSIIDREMEEMRTYPIVLLEDKLLVLQIGKQEVRYVSKE